MKIKWGTRCPNPNYQRYQNKFLRMLLPLIASDRISLVLEGWRVIRKLLCRLAQESSW
jgi:hypothetical protein